MAWYDVLSDDRNVRSFGLGTLRCMAFSPDGGRLATGGSLGATIWDHRAARVVRRIATPAAIEALAWSPDGRQLVLVSRTQAIYLADGELACTAWPPTPRTRSRATASCASWPRRRRRRSA